MTPRIRLLAPAAALLAVALACDDNPFLPGSFGVDDRWTGSVLAGEGDDTLRFHFDLQLEQAREVISGSGTVRRGAAATFDVAVDGRWEYPAVTLVLRAPDAAPLGFDGQFDVDSVPRPAPDSGQTVVTRPDSIMGTLQGSGLDGLRLELGRTPDDE